MFSLTKTIQRLDKEDVLYKEALRCYLGAISAFQEYPLETDAVLFSRFQDELRNVQAGIAETREPEVLTQSLEALSTILKGYYLSAAGITAENILDLRAVMSALGEAAQLLGRQHSLHGDKLLTFADDLQNLEELTDLKQIRAEIVNRVAGLRTMGDAAKKEGDRAILAMQTQLAEFKGKLDNAEQRASHDGLTGLLNRSEGEKRLRTIVQADRIVCALLIDLNKFKKVNDTWGHPAGDQVLRKCAEVLTEESRAGDLVCRWGGDEFLVVLLCNESVGRARAQAFQARLRIPQKVAARGKTFEVVISASIGITELLDGESAEDFVGRVDSAMYKQKRTASKPAGETLP